MIFEYPYVFSEMNKQLGQFFTTNLSLQQTVFSFIRNNPHEILEPSVGRGDLVQYVQKHSLQNIRFDMYEIDSSIVPLPNVGHIQYENFLDTPIHKKYKTIIGNPPYVKCQHGSNIYLAFIEKCFSLLDSNGELIFIVPSDFLRVTSSTKLLYRMQNQGTITNIYHPNNEGLFENASVDVIVFRYCKNPALSKTVHWNTQGNITEKKIYSSIDSFQIVRSTNTMTKTIGDYFNIYVGIVNGKESVYKHPILGNLKVLRGQNKRTKYIYINTFPTPNEKINAHLLQHKDILISRKIRKFNENNWFEWGALRNIDHVKAAFGKPCLYMHNLTRSSTVCFSGTVEFFAGNLLLMIPKDDAIPLSQFCTYFNSDTFRSAHTYANRFKIGQRELRTALLTNNTLL